MALSIGIIGLSNVGKTTIFNALTGTEGGAATNYPFSTVDSNHASVAVPDPRLEQLGVLAKSKKTVPVTVDFVDVAGLVQGAASGAGLGNKFLATIREADALLHIVRCFEDENVPHVSDDINPARDAEVVEVELLLADMETLEKRIERLTKLARTDKEARKPLEAAQTLMAHMESGLPISAYPGLEDEHLASTLKELQFLTNKKVIYVANVGEEQAAEDSDAVRRLREFAAARGASVLRICGKMEEDLIGLAEEDAKEFLSSYGLTESSLDVVVRQCYETLGLLSYMTVGPTETRAWTIRRGSKAPKAASVIHSDFERGFIRAQVIKFDDYVRLGSEAACKAAGVARLEGKEYEVQDGDVILFLFNV